MRSHEALKLSPFTRNVEVAQQWLETGGAVLDGVIAKRLDGVCKPGERAMLKVKKRRTAEIASSASFDTNVTALWRDLFYSASTMTRVNSITSGSPPRSILSTARS